MMRGLLSETLELAYETNLSTSPPSARAQARLSGQDAHQGRSRDLEPPAPQGPQTPDAGLSRVKRTLRKRERLQHGADFRRARYEGRRLTGRLMLLNVLRAEDLPGRRLGVVTSRQFGGAVARNRARRIVREAWRLIQEQLVTPCDVVVVVRRGMAGCAMQEVQEELLRLVKAAGVLKET